MNNIEIKLYQYADVATIFVNTRTGGGSENHTDWRGGGHIMPPIDLSSYES